MIGFLVFVIGGTLTIYGLGSWTMSYWRDHRRDKRDEWEGGRVGNVANRPLRDSDWDRVLESRFSTRKSV
jgi:hypothetical protein